MRHITAAVWCAAFLLVCGTAGSECDRKPASPGNKTKVPDRKADCDSKLLVMLITEAEAQSADPAGHGPLDNAITCLARSIYWEARGEGRASMEAVASVIMNRAEHDDFPNTICGVVKQGSEKGDCQFSWWCDGREDVAEDEESYSRAREISRRALNHQLRDRTGGALYFHHRNVNPAWAGEYIRTAEIGDHVFYRPAGGAAR